MNYDNPVFIKRHEAPFTWTEMIWPRNKKFQPCDVTIDLAEAMGWRKGKNLVIGPLRLRVMHYDVEKQWLNCYRDSGPVEEFVRGALFRVKELVTSPFHYYFGKKQNYG